MRDWFATAIHTRATSRELSTELKTGVQAGGGIAGLVKLFAGFTNSAALNGDKMSTLNYLFTLAMQHGGIWVSQGVLPSNSKTAHRNDENYLGSYSGAIAQSPSDAGAGEMSPGDLETARNFGERVAVVTSRFRK